jgi:hypothetical protein
MPMEDEAVGGRDRPTAARHTNGATAMSQRTLRQDFLNFLKNEKKWWLIPMMIVVLLVVGLLLLSRSGAVGPFLYPTL